MHTAAMDIAADPQRRALLTGACALLGLSFGAVLLADNATAAPGIKRLPDGRVQVDVRRIRGLRAAGGSANLGNVKGVPTAIVRTGPNRYKAINLRCTHQGVPVARQGEEWMCPAHGSVFSLEGALERGPAMRPLASVPARFNRGILTVG